MRVMHTEGLVHYVLVLLRLFSIVYIQGGSNMTGTDLCVKKPQCAAAVRP